MKRSRQCKRLHRSSSVRFHRSLGQALEQLQTRELLAGITVPGADIDTDSTEKPIAGFIVLDQPRNSMTPEASSSSLAFDVRDSTRVYVAERVQPDRPGGHVSVYDTDGVRLGTLDDPILDLGFISDVEIHPTSGNVYVSSELRCNLA